jgi:hypothetical protein
MLSLLGVQGCKSPEAKERWSNHFDWAPWGGSIKEQVQRPDRIVPEMFLLATVPLGFAFDEEIKDYGEDHSIDSGTEFAANALQVILPATAVTISGFAWAHGDQGRNFEVAAETLGGVVIVQQILANVISRDRPDHDEHTSFPSGHTSWAFAASTLIVRDIHDTDDHSFHAVDLLIYVPAMFSAWERIVIDKHWASDIAAGAFLGVFFTNWVWDAHYRDDGETRQTVFNKSSRRGVAYSPAFNVTEGGDLAVGIRMQF